MKIKAFFLLFSWICVSYAQTYCTGDEVSLAHQTIVHEVCAGMDNYSNGDEFRLADFNGDLNGGNYHITFIDMSASW